MSASKQFPSFLLRATRPQNCGEGQNGQIRCRIRCINNCLWPFTVYFIVENLPFSRNFVIGYHTVNRSSLTCEETVYGWLTLGLSSSFPDKQQKRRKKAIGTILRYFLSLSQTLHQVFAPNAFLPADPRKNTKVRKFFVWCKSAVDRRKKAGKRPKKAILGSFPLAQSQTIKTLH